MHVAAAYGTIKIIEVLSEVGADAASTDLAGSTPLQYALYICANEASLHLFLHLGASIVDLFRGMYADCAPSCQLQEPDHVITEIRVATGADNAKLDIYNDNPLRWAAASFGATFFRPPRTRLSD